MLAKKKRWNFIKWLKLLWWKLLPTKLFTSGHFFKKLTCNLSKVIKGRKNLGNENFYWQTFWSTIFQDLQMGMGIINKCNFITEVDVLQVNRKYAHKYGKFLAAKKWTRQQFMVNHILLRWEFCPKFSNFIDQVLAP